MSPNITNSENKSLLLVALVFGVVGVVPLLVGMYIYQQRSLFVAEANSAQGVVVEIFLATSNARPGSEDIKTYAPRVVFVAASNQKVEFRSIKQHCFCKFSFPSTLSCILQRTSPC